MDPELAMHVMTISTVVILAQFSKDYSMSTKNQLAMIRQVCSAWRCLRGPDMVNFANFFISKGQPRLGLEVRAGTQPFPGNGQHDTLKASCRLHACMPAFPASVCTLAQSYSRTVHCDAKLILLGMLSTRINSRCVAGRSMSARDKCALPQHRYGNTRSGTGFTYLATLYYITS